jgi:hypothetical protein
VNLFRTFLTRIILLFGSQVERNPKKKGYLRMQTSVGDLNIELHCDLVPRACENFITHCENGYYDNVIFHRNIKSFMIQVSFFPDFSCNCTYEKV